MRHPERIMLWVAARDARSRNDWKLAAELDRRLMLHKAGSRLDALEERPERLDARRRVSRGDNGLRTTAVIPMAEADQRKEEQLAAAEQGIDWASVASEVNTMLQLNQAANDAWQGQQGGKDKRKSQDS